MKAVAWLSAFMICTSLYAAFRLEHLVRTQQAAKAPELWLQMKQTAQHKAIETVDRLMH